MRVEKWVVISTGTVLTVASAIVGGSALAGPLTGSPPRPAPSSTGPTITASAPAAPSPSVTRTLSPTSSGTSVPSSVPSSGPPTATPSSTATPSATPSATTVSPAPSATASPTASPTGTPSAPFTLGWYPADSSTFDAGVIAVLPVKPRVVNYYSGWDEPFNTSFAKAAYADGIQTFVEMEPWNCGGCADGSVPEMTDIAAGGYDDYLAGFGRAIKAFGHPVLVTFAHEMNGGWYPWGYDGSEGTTPEQWIAAWDHVVTVVNAQAPGLVTWVWAPNVELGATSVAPYWPGARYVDEVGLDGYLSADSDTYQSEFGQTVADVRAVTGLPIWITETGVNQDDSAGERLADLATAVKQAGLTGMLYFDQGPAALTPDEEQLLANVIGPWVTSSPTPPPAPTLSPAPTLIPTPATTPPPTATPSGVVPSPSPSPDESSFTPIVAGERHHRAMHRRGFTVGYGSHPHPF